MWVGDPDSPPRGRAVGGGRAPEFRRPSQRQKAPPPGAPSRHPHSAQRQLARAHAVGSVLGPHAHSNRAREQLTGPQNPGCPPQGTGGRGRDSAGHQMPHTMVEGHPTRDGVPPPKLKGQCWAPTPAHPRPQHVGSGPRQPAQQTGSGGEGEGLNSDALHNGERHTPPRGRPTAAPTARNNGSQERTLWDWCWVPTPTPTAPGNHGSRNPGRPPQRTGGRGRDSA